MTSDSPTKTSPPIVIAGAGAGGLATALVAAADGQRVILVELTSRCGGTVSGSVTKVMVQEFKAKLCLRPGKASLFPPGSDTITSTTLPKLMWSVVSCREALILRVLSSCTRGWEQVWLSFIWGQSLDWGFRYNL